MTYEIRFDKKRKRWVLYMAGHPVASGIRLAAITRRWPDAKVVGK